MSRHLGQCTKRLSLVFPYDACYNVYATREREKFWQELSDPILDAAAEKAGLVPRGLFEQPLAQILQDLKSPDKHVKGKALELLALKIMSLFDLNFKWWIRRSADLKNTRVDLIAERPVTIKAIGDYQTTTGSRNETNIENQRFPVVCTPLQSYYGVLLMNVPAESSVQLLTSPGGRGSDF